MSSDVNIRSTSLYNTDYELWLKQTVKQLHTRDLSQLDLENLSEEIESLGKSDKRALFSYLMRLCEHLLIIKYWKSERELCFKEWLLEINHFRSEIDLILQASPSLKYYLNENFPMAYQRARKNLRKVVLLPSELIAEQPDFNLSQVLDEDWLPWQLESQQDR
jgi:hypothetical protein